MGWGTRIWLVGTAGFWVAMSVLLWRTEFGPRRPMAGSLPPGVVWKKVLAAPDQSTLEIRRGTNRIGSCVWRPGFGQETATGARALEDDEIIEGAVPSLAYYSLDLDGTVTLPDFPTRLRFNASIRLSTNFVWEHFDAGVTMRPDIYKLSADRAQEQLQILVDAGDERINRTLKFSELQNPQRLLQQLGGPALPLMATALGLPLSTNNLSEAITGLNWHARSDSIMVGHSRVRAYRLQTKLLDRWKVTFFVGPVGEILRAEFPGEIVLVNEHLAGLRNAAEND